MMSETPLKVANLSALTVKPIEWKANHGEGYTNYTADTPVGSFGYGTDAKGIVWRQGSLQRDGYLNEDEARLASELEYEKTVRQRAEELGITLTPAPTMSETPTNTADLVTVPREPTREMLEFGALAMAEPKSRRVLEVWRAMLAASPAHATGAMREALGAILAEAKTANDVIRLNRDGGGNGRVKVATAMHRIAKWADAAFSSPAQEGEAAPVRTDADGVNDRLGRWLAAALDDPDTCAEMKADIEAWFAALKPEGETGPAVAEGSDLDAIRYYVTCLDAVAFKRHPVRGLAEAEGAYNAAMRRLAALTISPSPSERDQHQGETLRQGLEEVKALVVAAFKDDRLAKSNLNAAAHRIGALLAALSTPEAVPVADKRKGEKSYGLGFTDGMTAEQLDEAERHCSAMLDQRGEHGGSPGEYWAEALMEIETARKRLTQEPRS